MDTAICTYGGQFVINRGVRASWDNILYQEMIHVVSRTWPVPTDIFDTESRKEDWFWTEEWQAGERAADEDIANGRYRGFKTADDLLSYLDDLEEK